MLFNLYLASSKTSAEQKRKPKFVLGQTQTYFHLRSEQQNGLGARW